MARPKGSKNKTKVEETTIGTKAVSQPESSTYTLSNKGVTEYADVREEKEEIKEVLKHEAPKLEPLAAGQAYFEAPDGEIIIGDEGKNEIWYRKGNDGKGMWINKKR